MRHDPGRRVSVAIAALLALASIPACPGGQPPAAAADLAFNQRMLELINRERVANGLPSVVPTPVLAAVAEDAPYLGCGFTVRGRAADMGARNYFSHSIPGCNNKSVLHVLQATGLVYSGAGENIAWVSGVSDPLIAAENLHSQLMASAGHRANILHSNFTAVGIGSWRTPAGGTWSGGGPPLPRVFLVAQLFASVPLSAGPPTTTTVATAGTGVSGRFMPLSPARILDTRTGLGGVGPIDEGITAEIQVAGRGGVPTAGVAAVVMNVGVVQPSGDGFMTVYPAGTARPVAANLNFSAGEIVSNLVVVEVGSNGKVALFNSGGTSPVIADVTGWYTKAGDGSAGRFEPVVPARIFDTRTGLGGGTRLAAGASVDVQVGGRGGVPTAGAQAAVVNLTVTAPSADGYVTVYPAGELRPPTSTVNVAAGATVANRTMIKLGAAGRITIYNSAGSADVLVDVSGWYTDASVAGTRGGFTPVVPVRILDTRLSLGGIIGLVGVGTPASVQVSGQGGVPASGARAVVLNATITQPTTAGYLTISPSGVARPGSSDVNFAGGDTQPNLVVVQLGADGRVSLFSSSSTHIILDVAGWMT